MTSAKLLYVCVRPQADAAAAEYESFRSAMRLRPEHLDRVDLVRELLPEDAVDRYAGFVVGGSPYNVADPEETKTEQQRAVEAGLEHLAQAAADARLAGMFTCFGIGVVTRLLGGDVTRAYPEGTGPVAVEVTDAGRRDPLFGPLASRFTALTAHKEGTGAPPPDAVLLATGEACPVQAYRVVSHLYATQFHPEPTPADFVERMKVYRNDGYFDADAFDATADRVLAASVTEPLRLLHAFAKAFGEA